MSQFRKEGGGAETVALQRRRLMTSGVREEERQLGETRGGCDRSLEIPLRERARDYWWTMHRENDGELQAGDEKINSFINRSTRGYESAAVMALYSGRT